VPQDIATRFRLRRRYEIYHVGIAALLGYGAAHAQESIWNGRSWIVTFKHLFDSVIFAALTAATFGLLWPKAL
jgi:hypothetical protein